MDYIDINGIVRICVAYAGIEFLALVYLIVSTAVD